MNRRALHRWTIWLLPLLLVRAFVPVGFMLAANEHGLSLILCSTIVPTGAASSADSQAHAHHRAHAGHQGQDEDHDAGVSDAAESTAMCPFAVGGAACTYELSHLAGVTPSGEYSPPSDSLLIPAVSPTRSDRIRAPPIPA